MCIRDRAKSLRESSRCSSAVLTGCGSCTRLACCRCRLAGTTEAKTRPKSAAPLATTPHMMAIAPSFALAMSLCRQASSGLHVTLDTHRGYKPKREHALPKPKNYSRCI
eukprot:TRINITY_DN51277_c0_g1_i1.p1 TRINITY_DN51277_c0_g1~~TRINITY_DN51277_c0_g1_i1.p1  ORF type:complete len:109 (+),score=14.37 TRINITY_DN51277_c0_g1_i1:66-392(+)